MTPTEKTPTTMTPTTMTQEVCPAPPRATTVTSNSSLTGAYLQQFNEMVKLIEHLPDAPESIGDILNWHPTTYQDYFNASAMPGRVSAADVYASLNRCVRQNFEGVVEDLDHKALGAVAVIRRHYKTHGEARPDIMTEICTRAGTHLREVLGKANDLVSHVPGSAGNFAQRRKLGASRA